MREQRQSDARCGFLFLYLTSPIASAIFSVQIADVQMPLPIVQPTQRGNEQRLQLAESMSEFGYQVRQLCRAVHIH